MAMAGVSNQPEWVPTFGFSPGVNNNVEALKVFDDGSGPALYVGGRFSAAGGVEGNFVAKWDGESWTPLIENELDGFDVKALEVFDDGSGPALYAAGSFTEAGGTTVNHIAKWDGNEWSGVGGGIDEDGFIFSLQVFDDGTGPALYAGGRINEAGGVPASRIARWDGQSWSAVGGGVDRDVLAMVVFDDGTGPALYAGGLFSEAGGQNADSIAKWDGTQWTPLGSGVSSFTDVITFDDGTGEALYVTGGFSSAGGTSASRIAKWDGSQWSALGSGLTGGGFFGRADSLGVFDNELYVSGSFDTAAGVPARRVAKWDGSNWSSLNDRGPELAAVTMAVFDAGEGEELYIGGPFRNTGVEGGIGAIRNRIVRWDGEEFGSLGTGLSAAGVQTLLVVEDVFQPGKVMFAGGTFGGGDGLTARSIAAWDGDSWNRVGNGFTSTVQDLEIFDSGTGPMLYAVGSFTQILFGDQANRIARWDGTSWSPLGSGLSFPGNSLAVFDDGSGPALYVGGNFAVSGDILTNGIAWWDGENFSQLAPQGANSNVWSLVVFDDGSGPALYAGGAFTTMGGLSVNGMARWTGEVWEQVGEGFGPNTTVFGMTVFDDGTGPALYATGNISTTGSGLPVSNLARWDGSQWTGVGGGLNDTGTTLEAFDDGSGEALYAGGNFTSAGGINASRIARWDGTDWSPLDEGLGAFVNDLAVFDQGNGERPLLAVGGQFNTSPSLDSFMAAWAGSVPSDPCPGDCNNDGVVNFSDLNSILGQFGTTGDGPGCDADESGTVNFSDLVTTLALFGACP